MSAGVGHAAAACTSMQSSRCHSAWPARGPEAAAHPHTPRTVRLSSCPFSELATVLRCSRGRRAGLAGRVQSESARQGERLCDKP